jgi:hypothetical protein
MLDRTMKEVVDIQNELNARKNAAMALRQNLTHGEILVSPRPYWLLPLIPCDRSTRSLHGTTPYKKMLNSIRRKLQGRSTQTITPMCSIVRNSGSVLFSVMLLSYSLSDTFCHKKSLKNDGAMPPLKSVIPRGSYHNQTPL